MTAAEPRLDLAKLAIVARAEGFQLMRCFSFTGPDDYVLGSIAGVPLTGMVEETEFRITFARAMRLLSAAREAEKRLCEARSGDEDQGA